ncbi:hypothetical protein AciX8_2311 [Granulicella mallensis MP5ACTX8]|uniref:Uncharacterized protein n=1 Tax=Granulicella mallensis (strain ATCC BAA-1857 / DSM 23137 / MP5ACTX8) TaxID=682795 RepID=G8NWB6_GRAMM|nr:hypothetical protein AciX8_2311 [Granulicella mallensis MP5ACTX8]
MGMRAKNWLVPIERPFRAYISQVILTQGFTLDAERDANACGALCVLTLDAECGANVCSALCVLTLGCDGVAPSGLEPVLFT